MVRLIHQSVAHNDDYQVRSQFQDGSINTMQETTKERIKRLSQFQDGSINTSKFSGVWLEDFESQFQDGSINTEQIKQPHEIEISLNSRMVRLIHRCRKRCRRQN